MKLLNVMAKKRSCSESFLSFDLSVSSLIALLKPQCVLCVQFFSAESMKSSELDRHLKPKRDDYKVRDLLFFERKVN